ncbi:adenylosuccinate synthetase [Caballeronia sp. LZ065]|uniref:adenylosuccinate synthetase n=1 Tax=Caballeronia sp. LZ065 TaxID=3038571 RepID=UPI00285CA302|nr:adenylosuccinate synthetase [Caballeronia sp. LZ065]MDR5781829.1 adenylosuccinate synthetase [Caballeronia sp. LZ065]
MFHAVMGLQFGDEGKGKFVDYLSRRYRHIARFNGGANAGHTVNVGETKAAFSQIPATLEGAKELYVCQGSLLSLDTLEREINYIQSVHPDNKIHIDPRCHIVLPIHAQLNRASEAFKGKKKIGSVGVGVGACFEDKANRHGIRLIDTQNPDTLRQKLLMLWDIRKKQIEQVFEGTLDLEFDAEFEKLLKLGKTVRHYECFTDEKISAALAANEGVLLETSQAAFLDCAFGTYPYTVAYQTLPQNCFGMIGIPAHRMHVLGVMKAYMIRVGNGPFPTELDDERADTIRERGHEYGTVSKRPRRCGWLDLPLVDHAVRLAGVTEIAITNVDVLGGMKEIWVCTGYRLNGRSVSANEALMQFADIEPVYERLPGWPPLTGRYHSIDAFPAELRHYLGFIQSHLSAKIRFVSYGPDRSETLRIGSHHPAAIAEMSA